MELKVQPFNVVIPAMMLFKRIRLRVGVIISQTLDNVMQTRRTVLYFSTNIYFHVNV